MSKQSWIVLGIGLCLLVTVVNELKPKPLIDERQTKRNIEMVLKEPMWRTMERVRVAREKCWEDPKCEPW